MADYKIVGLVNNNIMLEYDGVRRNFPLPIVDGLYPAGAELTALLDSYVAIQRVGVVSTDPVATNLADVLALVQPPTDVQLAVAVRLQRNQLLTRTDLTQLGDSSLSSTDKLAWAEYRTALKNLPTLPGFPSSVVWPIPPAPVTNPIGLALTNIDGSPVLPLTIRA